MFLFGSIRLYSVLFGSIRFYSVLFGSIRPIGGARGDPKHDGVGILVLLQRDAIYASERLPFRYHHAAILLSTSICLHHNTNAFRIAHLPPRL